MGIARYRESFTPHEPGTKTRISTGVVTEKSRYATRSYCDDVIGAYGHENTLSLRSYWVESGVFSGISGLYNYKDVCPSTATACNHLGGVTLDGKKRSQAAAILASNPGRPSLDLPVFLFELKDVPDMLKHAYKRASDLDRNRYSQGNRPIKEYLKNPKDPAKDWLNYVFGWRPLIKDAYAIANISAYASKRMKRIDDWNSGKRSTSAHISDLKGSTSSTGWYDDQTSSNGRWTTEVVQRSWLSANWTLSTEYYQALRESREQQILQALGVDLSISHVWNAMPWSWLVDWFADIGSVIEANSNRFGFRFKNGSVMTHTKWETTIRKTSGPSISDCGPVVRHSEFKTRNHASSLDGYVGFMNFMDPSRLATLSSLAVTKL